MYFSGKVSSVLFARKQTGYYILKMLLDGDKDSDDVGAKLVAAKGYVPGLSLSPGSWFGFEGKWVDDPTYGRQISITKAPVFKGKIDPETVVGLLVGNGVTDMVAYQLRRVFGNNISEALTNSSQIQEALEMSSLEAEFLVSRWSSILARMKALESLNNLNLPKGKVGEIWSYFGDDTEEILATNPWSLVAIEGIPFETMDELARSNDLSMKSPERHQAAVIYAVRSHSGQGDLYLTSRQLLAGVVRTVGNLKPEDIATAVGECHKNGSVIVDKSTRSGLTAIYDPWYYRTETVAARDLCLRVQTAGLESDDFGDFANVGSKTEQVVSSFGSPEEIVGTAVLECAEQIGLSLTEDQAQGILNGLLYPVSVLTGLPGTGKSTSMQVLVRVLQQTQTPYLLVAPTGIAAKRLSSVCKAPAYTIHRALGAKGSDEGDKREATYAGIVGEAKKAEGVAGRGEVWTCNPSSPHPARVVVIDEFSMVDQHLIYRLLQGTSPTTRMVFVGDAAQLPSVGPGNVLRDLISSKVVPVVSLTQIFRQEDTSDIVTAAHAIYRGETPSTSRDTDFVLLSVKEEGTILKTIVRLVEKLRERAELREDEEGSDALSFQVLSPRHMGTVGVTNLNATLRKAINPQSQSLNELKMGKDNVREGDRVMVIRNNYDLGVFNGDLGKVYRIDRKAKEVRVKIQGEPPTFVTFSLQDAYQHLRLAYACTVHKYQGLEVGTIIMPLILGFGRQLQRNLLYTAITRARRKVILVGSERALSRAVANDKEDRRNTLFVDRLQAAFSSSESGTEILEIA